MRKFMFILLIGVFLLSGCVKETEGSTQETILIASETEPSYNIDGTAGSHEYKLELCEHTVYFTPKNVLIGRHVSVLSGQVQFGVDDDTDIVISGTGAILYINGYPKYASNEFTLEKLVD